MLLLATDTSGKHGSIALAQTEAGGDRFDCSSGQVRSTHIIEVVPLAGGTFSAQLVPQIAALLEKHGFSRNDIDGFVVASGPGSFTGLRVGLAAIKALAEILGKPIAAVSLLEAIALGSGLQGTVIALLDAGRGEVYVGEYEVTGGSVKIVAEKLRTKEEVWAAGATKLATPDEGLAKEARTAGLQILLIARVNAGSLADIGWRKISAGVTVSAVELEANYIRRSDAEVLRKG
jgi:tRNA threonylcarbamoyladenosine biosynthesis protein TsaB